jgi:hypothetical protein
LTLRERDAENAVALAEDLLRITPGRGLVSDADVAPFTMW